MACEETGLESLPQHGDYISSDLWSEFK